VAADQVVVVLVAIEQVVPLAPQDRVIARIAVDEVVAAPVALAGADRGEVAVGRQRKIDLAVIAEEQVVARSAGDGVAVGAAHDRVVAVVAAQGIAAPEGGVGCGDQRELRGIVGDNVIQLAVVAEDNIVADVAADVLAAKAADEGVVALVALDDIVAALAGERRFDLLHQVVGIARDAAIVPDDDVIALIADQRVAGAQAGDRIGEVGAARAAEDGIVAWPTNDAVRAAVGGVGREDVVGVGAAVVGDDLSVVAQEDVVGHVVAAGDRVVARAAQDGVGPGVAVD